MRPQSAVEIPDVPFSSAPFRVEPLGPAGLPLSVQPAGDPAVDTLCAWLEAHRELVHEQLDAWGAIRFRGFAVRTASDFERIALAVDPCLENRYLGTSPRNALGRYVFSASELPSFYPIPQHCEMSFLRRPPRRLFFCCLDPPRAPGGETPLVDFRRVLAELDPAVRERFERRGLRIVRNYSGPGGKSRFDLWQLKRWDEMFGTRDRAQVEAVCREQGFAWQWLGRDSLRLTHCQPVTRTHPRTGEAVWHNHLAVFHVSAAAGEYARIFRLRPTARHFFFWQLARTLSALQRRLRGPDELAMHCTYADGSEIPVGDVEHVRDVIWRHMVIEPWQRGDVLAIDNFSVAHGRLPYRGPRSVAVAWSAPAELPDAGPR